MVPRRDREPTMVHTWLSCSARAGIAVNSRDPLRDYTDVLSFVNILSEWSLHFVSACRDILSKSIFSIFSDTLSWNCIYLQSGSYMLLHPWRSSSESRDEILLRGEGYDTPGVCFVLWREIYPNLGCSVKISISRSCLSLFIQISHSHFIEFRVTQSHRRPILEPVKTFNSWHEYELDNPSRIINLIWSHLIKFSTAVIWSEPESNSSNPDRCPTILIRVRTLKRNTRYVVL
jgi:hypothetical protein